ncbi:FAD-dependent monooxygenase [Streptomyces sp. NPDC092296]|uniref:FAD-dependent monooxygenase n=1 Tax=Streptomyces sp. NPDC092296 TaxID=3366012 RepID=UPI0037FBDFE5
MTTHPDVLIVGAGPTGLVLGCDLARRGVRARIVEAAPGLFPGSRGKGLQPRTQEVFDDLGVIDAVLADGGPYPLLVHWQDGERGHEWALEESFPADPRVPYGDACMLPQWRTQEILYDRLRELGGSVEFGTRLTGLDQDADAVHARLSTGGGPAVTVRADYLVGGDGGRSTVRRALGIGMAGETVDPAPMLVADVRVDGLDRRNWHVWHVPEVGQLLLCPLAGTDQFQLVARYVDPQAVPDTTPDGVRAVLAARSHLTAEQVTEVRWASDFRPRAALADRFRVGRAFLAGDAAHIHSPAGGQGLNTSVQDAYNLGWKLGQVLRHGAHPDLLDSYQAERLPVAADVLGISTRLHSGMEGGQAAWMARSGPQTRQLGVGYRGGPLAAEHRADLPEDALHAGDRAPDALGTTPDGAPLRLFDAFRGPHFTLLAVGTALPAVGHPFVRAHRVDGPAVRAAYGAGLFLVRPDGYLGLAATDPADLSGYLARFTG